MGSNCHGIPPVWKVLKVSSTYSQGASRAAEEPGTRRSAESDPVLESAVIKDIRQVMTVLPGRPAGDMERDRGNQNSYQTAMVSRSKTRLASCCVAMPTVPVLPLLRFECARLRS